MFRNRIRWYVFIYILVDQAKFPTDDTDRKTCFPKNRQNNYTQILTWLERNLNEGTVYVLQHSLVIRSCNEVKELVALYTTILELYVTIGGLYITINNHKYPFISTYISDFIPGTSLWSGVPSDCSYFQSCPTTGSIFPYKI